MLRLTIWALGTSLCGTEVCTALARTRDGGATWHSVPVPAAVATAGPNGVSRVRFANASDGWLFGPQVWAYAIGLSTNAEVTRRITEWQPTTVRTVPGMLFFGSVALVVLLLVRRRESPSWPLLLGLAAFAVLGAYAIRGVAWWPLGAVSLVAPLIAATPSHVPGREAPRGLVRPRLARVRAGFVGTEQTHGDRLLSEPPALRVPDRSPSMPNTPLSEDFRSPVR